MRGLKLDLALVIIKVSRDTCATIGHAYLVVSGHLKWNGNLLYKDYAANQDEFRNCLYL